MNAGEAESRLDELAQRVFRRLETLNSKIVFAESCTGGKMAAAITTVPGISSCFCGSAVTYREATKTQWLSVDEADLQQHSAESEFVTITLAQSVLKTTAEADFAIAITGHLGPGVASDIDGKIYVVVSSKHPNRVSGKDSPRGEGYLCGQFQLASGSRKLRQTEAAYKALEFFLAAVKSDD